MSETKSKFFPEYRIYRAKNDGKGSASKFQLRVGPNQNEQERVMLFLESAPQTGVDENKDATFGWKEKDKTIIMKLGVNDVGEILSVLSGVKSNAGSQKGLYHENEKGNTVLKFSFLPPKEGSEPIGYYLQLSSQRDGKDTKIGHSVSFGEAEALKVLLQEFIKMTYQWY